jgi:hypothetical protein
MRHLLTSWKYLFAILGLSSRQLAQPRQPRYTSNLSRSKKGAQPSISKTLLSLEPATQQAWLWRRFEITLTSKGVTLDTFSAWEVARPPSTRTPLNRRSKSSSRTWLESLQAAKWFINNCLQKLHCECCVVRCSVLTSEQERRLSSLQPRIRRQHRLGRLHERSGYPRHLAKLPG